MKMIVHKFNGLKIRQRADDGYINATEMCKVADKRWNNYWRQKGTQEYLIGLAEDLDLLVIVNNPVTLIRATALIQVFQGGDSQQGTWVHPEVATDLAQWVSVPFRIRVNRWIVQWMTTGQNPIAPAPNAPTDLLAEINRLEKLIVSIRSQARTFHTGSHQPTDDYLVKSLHTISHNQLSIINSTIQRLQKLKQVAEMNSELEINADIDRDELLNLEMGNPISKPEPKQQPAAKPTMKEITAANFIDNIPVVTKEATVRFTVDLPESMHRNLSIFAAKKGQSKADIIRMVLDEALVGVEE